MELLSKKNLIIIVILFLVIGVASYLWIAGTKSDTSVNPQSGVNLATETSADLQAAGSDEAVVTAESDASINSQIAGVDGVVVVTDKAVYERGENIRFVIANNTKNTIWYIVPASKCDKNFYGQMSAKNSDTVWADWVTVWLSCGDKNAGADSLKISKLEPGKRVEEIWNQDMIYSYTGDDGTDVIETDKMFPYVYRFGFPYSEKEIFLKDIPPLDVAEKMNFLPKQAFSADFEIKDDGTRDLASKKAQDAMRKSSLSYIYSRLISYFDDHNDKYPISGDKMVKLNDKNSAVYKELVPEYLSDDFMKDPKDPDSYFGYRSLDGKDFELTAVLENSADKDCIKTNNLCIYKFTSNGAASGQ